MTRDELVAAGAKALSDAWRRGTVLSQDEYGRWKTDYRKFAAAMLDVVEPLIREAERARVVNDAASVDAVARRAAEVIHADPHARVAALHSQARDRGKDGHVILWVDRDEVLALLDGRDA